jgi:hypothetical protein
LYSNLPQAASYNVRSIPFVSSFSRRGIGFVYPLFLICLQMVNTGSFHSERSRFAGSRVVITAECNQRSDSLFL